MKYNSEVLGVGLTCDIVNRRDFLVVFVLCYSTYTGEKSCWEKYVL